MIGAEHSENNAFKLLFDAAPDAILVVDSTGRIRINNAEAERLLEAAPGELHGLSVDKLVPIAGRKRHAGLRGAFVLEPHRRPMGVGLALKALKEKRISLSSLNKLRVILPRVSIRNTILRQTRILPLMIFRSRL